MKKTWGFFKKTTLLIILFSLSFTLAANNSAEEELKLTRKLLFETGRVLASTNNRAVLDEIYLLEWYEDISTTNSQYILSFRDDINEFKSIDVKRERLEYIYNQNRSMAAASLVPNALSVATVAFSSGNPKQAVIAIAGTALSSITNYLTTKQRAELELIQSQWNLDDDASRAFNNLNNAIFANLTTLSRDYGFSRDDYASIATIQNFVKDVQNENITPSDIIQICVGTNYERELSQFSDYWRIVGSAYYELGEYNEALTAINQYEKCYEKVFYHDPNYAQMMMIKAYCIDELSINKEEIVDELIEIANAINENLGVGRDWLQKYYCYLIYKDVASYTNDNSYLKKAFEVLDEVFYININTYAKDLENYLSYQFLEDIITGLEQNIAEIDNEIANQKEQRKAANTKERKEIIDKEIEKLKANKKEFEENIDAQKEIAKKTLPPSVSLLISLAYEYKNLAEELGETDSVKYRNQMKRFSEAIQDDYTRVVFLGETIEPLEADIKYEYHHKVLGLGNPIDVMTFRLPLSYFTIISDDFSEMILEFSNTQKNIEVQIPYSNNSKTTGWDYEIVREGSDEFNMKNTFVEFTVHFEEPIIGIEKDEDPPSLFMTFKGVNNQLERMLGMNILTPAAFEKGFFYIVK